LRIAASGQWTRRAIVEEQDTRVFDEQPPEVRRPRTYGQLPHLPVLALGIAAVVAAVVILAVGATVVGVILIAIAVVVLVVFVHEATRSPSARLDGSVAAGSARARALSGYATASMRAWTGATRRVASLRLRAYNLARERRKLQLELGGAVYSRNAADAADLSERMHAIDDEIARCGAEAARAVREAQERVERERLAIQPTRVNRAVR
jgi:hypothetical protein